MSTSPKTTATIQQPATPEPVLTVEREPDYWSSGHFYEGNKPHINPTKVWSLPIGTKLYTHTAPSVPADVVRDAERYRFIRDADVSDDLIPDIALYAMESLDEYIDAAMLAAKTGGAA